MMCAILFLLLLSTSTAQHLAADKQPVLVSQNVTGRFEVQDWWLGGGTGYTPDKHSGKMALYINADSGNIRLDYSEERPYYLSDFETQMSRYETSYLLSHHDKKIYKTTREYYSNGTEVGVFTWEHAVTMAYHCDVAELPDAESSKYMSCVCAQFSKRWFTDQYELKDSYKVPPADGPSSLANLLELYVHSNYGIHFNNEGGINEIDMSESLKSFNIIKMEEKSGSWKTEYSLGKPEANDPTVFDAPVFKPDKAPGPMPPFSWQRIDRDCTKPKSDDPFSFIPLHMGKGLSECLSTSDQIHV